MARLDEIAPSSMLAPDAFSPVVDEPPRESRRVIALSQAVSAAAEDTDKQRRALDLLGARALALSVQVIQEFYVQAIWPSRPGPSRMRRPWASSNLFNVFPSRRSRST